MAAVSWLCLMVSHPGPVQVPQALGNPGSYPTDYVKFAVGDPDNQCVLPNGHYRVRQLALRRYKHAISWLST